MYGYNTALTGPATDFIPLTPDDETDVPDELRALYVGEPGLLTVTTFANRVVTFPVFGSPFVPLAIKRLHRTGTTATQIFGIPVE